MNDNKMTPIELRATWGLGVVFSLRMLGIFMVLPVVTTYGIALRGANETLIGLAIGIYGLTQAIFQIPFALLSDRIGRKPMIVGGLILFSFGSIIAATTTSIWGVILGRALQGSGAIAAVVMALLSDLTREQNRTKAMAFIGSSFGVTFAIAMVVGPIVTHAFGLQALFWMIAVLSSLGIVTTLLVVPNAPNHILNRESGMVKCSIRKVLINPKLLKLNISIFCLHVLLMLTFVVLPCQLEHSGVQVSNHWKVYLVTMLVAFVAVIPFIIYAEVNHRMKRVFISCVVLLILAEIVLWHAAGHFGILLLGVQMFFFAFNLMEAILPSLISKESPAGYKGTAMGIYSTSQFLGVAIGGSMGGWIYDYFNAQTVFLVGATVATTWLFVSLSMQEPPYVSSLRIVLSDVALANPNLERLLKTQPGVASVFIVLEEKSAYIKIYSNVTSRGKLEAMLASC